MDLINKNKILEIIFQMFLLNLNQKLKQKVLNYYKEYLKIILVLKFEYMLISIFF